MENKSLRFYAIMALWVVLFVLLFVSNRRVDLKTDINKSTSVSVSVEDTVSLSPSVVTTRAYSAGDDTYQAFFRILQNASCYQKFNQNVRSYSHDYEAHSITLRFADDASQNLLFTVYSDGVCQVNGKFVFLRSPDGNAEAIYQLLRDAVVDAVQSAMQARWRWQACRRRRRRRRSSRTRTSTARPGTAGSRRRNGSSCG